MIEELVARIWSNPAFHSDYRDLTATWLRRELGVGTDPSSDRALTGATSEEGEKFSDALLVRCAQSATILSSSPDPEQLRVAYSAAACAADLGRDRLPGLDGALRIVLGRMGNFPAIATSEFVSGFGRLPMSAALAEELRRTDNRVSVGDWNSELTDFQMELWKLLQAGENVAISAPTSAGKSYVLQAFLRARARAQKITSAVYLVPSRALIAQVGDAIAEWRKLDGHQQLSLVTIPIPAEVPLREPAIYVLTQERMQAILRTHPSFKADLVICDEAQGVDDGARGVLLQNVVDDLLGRHPQTQAIFAGPNIRNLHAFGSIFDIKLLREVANRVPTVVQNLILVNTRSLETGVLSVSRHGETGDLLVGQADIRRALPTKQEKLIRVAERFGRLKPSIIYADGPSAAEKVARGLKQAFEPLAENAVLADLINLSRSAVHRKFDLGPCLEHGVGFHYGRIPALVRRGIEAAFAQGHIRYLVTTSTLIQGVNFPAANLFVCQPKKGNNEQLDPGEFWNLAGRAGRLGKEFQGNIFLIDYQDWDRRFADEPNEIEVTSAIAKALRDDMETILKVAGETTPPLENDRRMSVEAAFARLLADHMAGRLSDTLDRFEVPAASRTPLVEALEGAKNRIGLPLRVIEESPTVSAIRQQRLADYLASEIKGGGVKRLEELTPRHPRDEEAYLRLSEIFKVCHRYLLSLSKEAAPKLHSRMAAIALKWMRGRPVPEIVDENHKRNGGGDDYAKSIRDTLRDIEQEIRFKYLRLTSCYLNVLAHVLREAGHATIANRLPDLASHLEVGAADRTMISLIGLGISRVTARELTEENLDKDMDTLAALGWLRKQDLESVLPSSLMREEVERVLRANA